MAARLLSWAIGLTISLVISAASALADGKRVALVIGNSAYKYAAELRNPRNDAQDVIVALDKLGFTIVSGFDLDHAGLRRTISRFAAAIESAEVGVFFYAGHGIQVNSSNFLVPVDAKLEDQYSPSFELIPVSVVQQVMENKNRTNIIFLDACRDNPLSRNLARAMGTRSTSVGRGLSPTESGIGTLVSYSTQPGNVAVDGDGRNSPYAAGLVRQLTRSGVAITDMLIDVRREVIKATRGKQIPWEHSALTDRFYFSPPEPVPLAPLPPPPPEVTQSPLELTPAQRSSLARHLNRELKRVGCDPKVSDGTWPVSSQEALQQFMDATKLALHSDEPTKAALDAVTMQKVLVCPRAVTPSKPVTAPPPLPERNPTPAPVAATPAPSEPAAAPPSPIAAPTKPVPARAPPPESKPAPAPIVAAPSQPEPAAPPPIAAPSPRPLPGTASVRPPPPAASAPAKSPPVATKVERKRTCRDETEAECYARTLSTYRCRAAYRKTVCE